jgi:hypothetical protein
MPSSGIFATSMNQSEDAWGSSGGPALSALGARRLGMWRRSSVRVTRGVARRRRPDQTGRASGSVQSCINAKRPPRQPTLQMRVWPTVQQRRRDRRIDGEPTHENVRHLFHAEITVPARGGSLTRLVTGKPAALNALVLTSGGEASLGRLAAILVVRGARL